MFRHRTFVAERKVQPPFLSRSRLYTVPIPVLRTDGGMSIDRLPMWNVEGLFLFIVCLAGPRQWLASNWAINMSPCTSTGRVIHLL